MSFSPQRDAAKPTWLERNYGWLMISMMAVELIFGGVDCMGRTEEHTHHMKCHFCIREYADGKIEKEDIQDAVSQAGGTAVCFDHCLTIQEREKVKQRAANRVGFIAEFE